MVRHDPLRSSHALLRAEARTHMWDYRSLQIVRLRMTIMVFHHWMQDMEKEAE